MSDSTRGRAGLAALGSSLIPGVGQLLTGRSALGWVLLVVDTLVIATLAGMSIFFPSVLLSAWVTPTALVAILAVNVIVFLYRALATGDSFFQPQDRGVIDWMLGLLAAAVVVLPHLYIAGLVLTQNDLINTVFTSPDPVAAPAVAPASTTATTVPTSGDAAVTTLPATTTTTAPPRFWDGKERLNVLLLGSDAGVGRIGTRTDTMILVSVEPESGDVAMFHIPRNLTEAPLPEGMGLWDCNCFPDILTHLWANGEWYPEAFPGPQSPSVNALKAAVGMTFDLDVHYYAKVDLAGFVGLIDAMGGVTIDVPQRLVDESYPHENGGTEYIVFEPGKQHLDGHRALAYARIRRHSGDFARMHRQRCVLAALADQTSVFDLLGRYGAIAEALKQQVETDIPIEHLDDFVELIPRIDTERMGTLRITRYNYGAGGHAGYQLYDLEQIKADAKALMADPTIHLPTQDGDGIDATCDESFD